MSGPLAATAVLLLLAAMAFGAHPVLPVRVDKTQPGSYIAAAAEAMAMSEADLLAIIPRQSGLYFTDCPNCESGLQEGQFGLHNKGAYTPWEPAHPLVMRCAFCGHEYPSDTYPMRGTLAVHGPDGRAEEYPYWEDARGYRHYFGARIDDHRIRFMEETAQRLGRAYAATGDAAHARRCALILQRFAEVYPGYCYHFDYPFQDKVIYDGDVAPKDLRAGFRTARWTWWAYMDVPARLVEAYDLIYESGELEKLSAEKGNDVAAEIQGFFAAAVGQVLANQDDLTNMSPGMWASVIQTGRVLGRPEWVHEVCDRLDRFVGTGFHYDGTWSEGAPSYHAQVVGALGLVQDALEGYRDPAGFRPPPPGRRFDGPEAAGLPAVQRARDSLDRMRLPDGRFVPVHDTWSTDRRDALSASHPYLLGGLGHGCLAGGEGPDQWQVHLTWSAGQGHQHCDGLGLLLYAGGREVLSDLGYSHSRDRAWTLPTAAHNTVVIDHLSQVADRTTYGALRYLDADDAGCQVLSVDNPSVYPGLARTYRRTVITVGGEYVVDLFEVVGGRQHDYFLHGCADLPGTVRAQDGGRALPTEPLATLLPPGTEYAEAMNEGECGLAARPAYAYGYLRDLQRLQDPLPAVIAVDHLLGDDGRPALRAHLLTEPGDQLVLGRNPAVRGAREDDGKLRDHWRPFAMWRRPGGQSRFAAVLEPLTGTPRVTGVRRLDWPDVALAVEVWVGDRRDLVLLRPHGLQVAWRDQPLTATAELVVLSDAWATVVDGQVSWGALSAEAAPAGDHPLVAVDAVGGTLTVQGEFLPPAGTVVVLDQAGQRVSPFTVAAAHPVGENTQLAPAESVPLLWDAATQTSQFVCQPRTTHQGPHVVRSTPIAHAARR